ncbi:MAG: hypothetical protein WCE75_15200 [Terracidiphilus sp.]
MAQTVSGLGPLMTKESQAVATQPPPEGLRGEAVASVAIAGLMAGFSVTALLRPALIYPTPELVRAFQANDAVNLGLGVPALLTAVWLARRGALAGVLLWPGALLYALYNYLAAGFALIGSPAVAPVLALVALSLYTVVSLMARTGAEAVRQQLAGRVRERTCGAVLAVLGLLVWARSLYELLQPALHRTPLPVAGAAVDAADFLVAPAFLLGGILLWRRRAPGYLAGLGLLFLASLLFVGLIAFLILQPVLAGARQAPDSVAAIALMGLVVWIPFGIFLRGVLRARRRRNGG